MVAIGLAESFRVAVGWATPTGTGFNNLKEEYAPGTLGFDPLGLLPEDDEELRVMQTRELNNGRLAMVSQAENLPQHAHCVVPTQRCRSPRRPAHSDAPYCPPPPPPPPARLPLRALCCKSWPSPTARVSERAQSQRPRVRCWRAASAPHHLRAVHVRPVLRPVFEHLALYLEREVILEIEDLDPALNLPVPTIPPPVRMPAMPVAGRRSNSHSSAGLPLAARIASRPTSSPCHPSPTLQGVPAALL